MSDLTVFVAVVGFSVVALAFVALCARVTTGVER